MNQSPAPQNSLFLWTESAIPWTYESNDPFIDSLKKIGAAKNWEHIIGISTLEPTQNNVYNSAYLIKGKDTARYDKRYLLDMVEQPLFNINLPFLETDGYKALPGTTNRILNTRNFDIGVLICNESNISKAALSHKESGANLLYTMSNDSWFANSKLLSKIHFLNARVRACETGLNMLVNSNLGYSGAINSLEIVESQVY